jgi:myo-inositol-1(or 4)-monophosphatase
VDDAELLAVLHAAADAVRDALGSVDDWGLADTRPGQYHSDVAADDAAVAVLVEAGLGVLSEESGQHHADRPVMVVLDPLDGSTNASRGLAWYGTSLCALDEAGPRAAVVANQATGVRYEAARGAGAHRDGQPIRPSGCEDIGGAMVCLSGFPPHPLGWQHFRALGAAALDLCAVADGTLDAYVDCRDDSHAAWDYLGSLLICREAGAHMADAKGRDLLTRRHEDRRVLLAAATEPLLGAIADARASFGTS